MTVWDVFLIDQDFAIERPTRYYRQGLNLLHQLEGQDDEEQNESPEAAERRREAPKPETLQLPSPPRKRLASTVGSIKSSISRAFQVGGSPKKHRVQNGRISSSVNNLTADGSRSGHRPSNDTGGSIESASSVSGPPSRPLTPMLDPSTNTNPLDQHEHDHEHDRTQGKPGTQHKKRGSKDVSKHVFYVVNSQTRLKLHAKNERQMLQWIAALERVARESHYTGKNRFDSFAPIRLNVAAQWLVDGVRRFFYLVSRPMTDWKFQRDYFWNLSRAILLARETIQIHDWWLSPGRLPYSFR